MRDQAGRALSAVAQRLTGLSRRQSAAVEADEVLAAVLGTAYANTVNALRRFDEMEAAIGSVLERQDDLALDTAAGARELQRLLLEMQLEITALVETAVAEADANKLVLEGILSKYPSVSG